jgi:tetratricopeptide (TPR) repeat protein
MTCGDCHDSHSNDYRDINGRRLQGRFDNDQCLSCHPSKARSLQDHTFHKPESKGSLCVSCHMPYLQHPNLGDKLRFSRSDHTIPIPRPAFDAEIGIEDACIKCHGDKGAAWNQSHFDTWYGEIKPHKPVVTALLAETKETRDRITAGRGLLNSVEHPMGQVAGLSTFAKKYLDADMPGIEAEVITALQDLAQSVDPDVKALAMMSLHLAAGQRSDIRGFLEAQLAGLGEDEPAVRARWSVAMDYLGTLSVQAGNLQKGIRLHKKALEISPDDPVALVNLGSAYGNQGLLERAIGCFRRALEIDPGYEAARLNLATAYGIRGEPDLALAAYEEAVALKPVSAKARIQLARAYLGRGRTDEAVDCLRQGLQLDPLNGEMQSMLQNLQMQ